MGPVIFLCGLIMLPLLLDVLALAFYGFLCFLGYLIRFLALCAWKLALSAGQGFLALGRGAALGAEFLFILIDEWRQGAPPEEPIPEQPAPKPDRDDEYYRQFKLNDPPQEEKPLPPPDPYLQALNILGLSERFTQAELNRAYKLAIRKAHPDTGGSKEKAQAVNTARDFVARRHGFR